MYLKVDILPFGWQIANKKAYLFYANSSKSHILPTYRNDDDGGGSQWTQHNVGTLHVTFL